MGLAHSFFDFVALQAAIAKRIAPSKLAGYFIQTIQNPLSHSWIVKPSKVPGPCGCGLARESGDEFRRGAFHYPVWKIRKLSLAPTCASITRGG
jgi:hypothetical protein